MVTLKRIIGRSFDLLTSRRLTDSVDIPQAESDAIAQAILQHFHSQLTTPHEEEGEETEEIEGQVSVNMDAMNWNKLNEIVSMCFPGSPVTVGSRNGGGGDAGSEAGADDGGVKTELVEAIKTQLKEHHLQDLPMFQEKVYSMPLKVKIF